jgi:hypothetical protein
VSGSSKKIVFVNQGKNWGEDIPTVEVKVESRDWAFKIINTFVEKRREGKTLEKSMLQTVVALQLE